MDIRVIGRPGWRRGLAGAFAVATLVIDMPETTFANLGGSAEEFGRRLRLAAAIHWYERGEISQGRGAEVAGLSRRAFLEALGQAGVDAIQVAPEELEDEVERDLQARRERLAADLPDAPRTP